MFGFELLKLFKVCSAQQMLILEPQSQLKKEKSKHVIFFVLVQSVLAFFKTLQSCILGDDGFCLDSLTEQLC